MDFVMNWSIYGRGGRRRKGKPAKMEDWSTKPFESPVTEPWNVSIPPGGWKSLRMGFKPLAMEDKWFVYTEEPDDKGCSAVYFIRSWTGFPVAKAKIEMPMTRKGPDEKAARFTEITWESSAERFNGPTSEQAKEWAIGVCSRLLGVDLGQEEQPSAGAIVTSRFRGTANTGAIQTDGAGQATSEETAHVTGTPDAPRR
jgi:hypothetical protein